MLKRIWIKLFDRHVAADADRLIRSHGPQALETAEHSARAAREEGDGHWSRVAQEIARQTRRRPF